MTTILSLGMVLMALAVFGLFWRSIDWFDTF